MNVCESDVSHSQNNFNYLNCVHLISDVYECVDDLKIIHFDCCSLINKINEFRIWSSILKPGSTDYYFKTEPLILTQDLNHNIINKWLFSTLFPFIPSLKTKPAK